MLTVPVVFRVAPAALPDDEDDGAAAAAAVAPLPPRVRKSDLIKPALSPILTLDHAAGSCSRTSTFVPDDTVMTTSAEVVAATLRLTPSVVVNVAGVFPIGNFRKSERINPVELPALTCDHPAGLWSSTSTLSPSCTTVKTLASVLGADLTRTLSVAQNVPTEADVVCIVCVIPSVKQKINIM